MRITVSARTSHPRLTTMQVMDFFASGPMIEGQQIRVGHPAYVDESQLVANDALLRGLVRDGYVDLLDEEGRPWSMPQPKTYDPMAPLTEPVEMVVGGELMTVSNPPELKQEPELQELPPLPPAVSMISLVVQPPTEVVEVVVPVTPVEVPIVVREVETALPVMEPDDLPPPPVLDEPLIPVTNVVPETPMHTEPATVPEPTTATNEGEAPAPAPLLTMVPDLPEDLPDAPVEAVKEEPKEEPKKEEPVDFLRDILPKHVPQEPKRRRRG